MFLANPYCRERHKALCFDRKTRHFFDCPRGWDILSQGVGLFLVAVVKSQMPACSPKEFFASFVVAYTAYILYTSYNNLIIRCMHANASNVCKNTKKQISTHGLPDWPQHAKSFILPHQSETSELLIATNKLAEIHEFKKTFYSIQ